MEKPFLIKKLEEQIGINLSELDYIYRYSFKKGYQIEDNKIVGLTITNIELKDIYFLNDFQDLKYLNLSTNLIEDIDVINNLKNLERLFIGRNRISNINHINLKQLKILDIYSNPLEELCFENELPELELLDLSFNRLIIFSFKNLKNLKKLNLNWNKIKELQDCTVSLNLEELILSHNKIYVEDIVHFKKLKILLMYSCNLSDISIIGNLKKIERLDLGDNFISNAETISNLKELKYLRLSYNQLSSCDFIENLENLIEISFESNKISRLPDLKKLKKLTNLNFQYNLIKNSLDSINNLDKLVSAQLSFNRIEVLPELNLNSLKKLYLYNNKISYIEKYNPKLKYYYHTDNRFNGVLLGNNPLDNSLIEILKIENNTEKQKQLSDYFSNLELGSAPLLEAKLMILGEGESGKTNLRNYIIDNSFEIGKSATTGINIDTWKQKIYEKDYRINIWDFGGQWIQQQVHQFFLTNESVYIVLLNARQDEKPEKWLDWIKNYTKDSKVFVVANKMDENPNFSLQENLLKTEYPFIVGFHYI